ncbi:MAG: hypothetical protein CSA40_02015 [Flavobacteriales bacterium]|nr:MAG: hypothetical protein CSA40_02015 [Flavobacteriales bacterium]
MRQLFLSLILLVGFSASIIAQETEAPKEGWTRGGTFGLTLNQSSFSNWVAGGDNAISGSALVNYDANLLSGDWTWDNKLILAYGLTNTKSNGTIKTDDRFEFNSLAGKQASDNWYYSAFLGFLTQFTNGYDYVSDPNQNYQTSGLFAPAYLSFGPGMLWKKSDNLKVNIAPATVKLTFLGSEVFTFDKDNNTWLSSNNVKSFGIDPGESLRFELGLNIGAYYKVDLMKNISMENILNLYSNYLDQPDHIDINHQLSLVMQVNKYISANLMLNTIYDHDMLTDVQFKEVFGVGFNYTF